MLLSRQEDRDSLKGTPRTEPRNGAEIWQVGFQPPD
jgi:hypothetical protein